VVYDIFDLPRGSALDRGATFRCYPEESARELTKRRSKAIEDCTGFTLDAEIISFKGNRRWIRITATVESVDGVAVRIFGIKQDITEEKILSDRTRYLAEFDVLTGLANRSQFQTRLSALDLSSPQTAKPFGALLLIDLDEFKPVNDSLGHAAGDECLKQAAERIRDVCADADLVARIGGDEFAVLLGADTRDQRQARGSVRYGARDHRPARLSHGVSRPSAEDRRVGGHRTGGQSHAVSPAQCDGRCGALCGQESWPQHLPHP